MILSLTRDALPVQADPPSLYYRHPEYVARWWWREFNRVSYVGGREYARPCRLSIEFDFPLPYPVDSSGMAISRDSQGRLIPPSTNTIAVQSLLFRHNREQTWEFENRRRRAHYTNIVKAPVNMLVSHALKQGVTRTGDDVLTEFWSGCDYERKQDFDVFLRDGLRMAQVEGMMFCFAGVKDKTDDADDPPDGKPYVYWVNPLDVFDWLVDDNGEYVWLKQFIYVEQKRDPREGVKPLHRFRIWYRDRVEEIDVIPGASGNSPGTEGDVRTTSHDFGRVPCEPLYSMKNNEAAFPDGEPLVSDLAKAANCIYQYKSLLDEIAYKQTFSQLVLPTTHFDALQLGTSSFIGYDPLSGGGEAKYISPDPQQARVLGELIANELEQARQSFGTGRGRQEASMQKSSGTAMELESEDKRSILADIASAGNDFEMRLIDLIGDLRKQKTEVDATIIYPTEFDVTGFIDDVKEALSLQSLGMSPEIMLHLRQQLAARKLGGLPEEEKKTLIATLKLASQELEQSAAEAGAGERVTITPVALSSETLAGGPGAPAAPGAKPGAKPGGFPPAKAAPPAVAAPTPKAAPPPAAK